MPLSIYILFVEQFETPFLGGALYLLIESSDLVASTNLFESVFVGLASFAPLTGAGGICSHLYFEVTSLGVP